MNRRLLVFIFAGLFLSGGFAFAGTFHPPTSNRSLFKLNEQEKYFASTTGKSWTSGTFGCTRSGGGQMHEGIDIRCIQRDKNGEPADPILATADGKVAYINNRPSLSNYGNYIILQHRMDGLEIYSTYAHLREIRDGLKIGQPVKAGEIIGIMGRTTNTRERISQERAHVHFEINFFINDRFSEWHKRAFPGVRDDHGIWNGKNMIGIDPRLVLLASNREERNFDLLAWVRNQTELCRVMVRKPDFPWLRRYPALVRRNPIAETQGVAGFEIALNYNGLPFQLIPRAASEIKTKSKYQLLSVNKAEYQKNPCRQLVFPRKESWDFGNNGLRLLDLLTY